MQEYDYRGQRGDSVIITVGFSSEVISLPTIVKPARLLEFMAKLFIESYDKRP
jgi:hypothetical protein